MDYFSDEPDVICKENVDDSIGNVPTKNMKGVKSDNLAGYSAVTSLLV